jgi:acetylglutamate kinase
MQQLTLIKAGGATIEDRSKAQYLLENVMKIQGRKILVHGGGNLATELAEKLQIPVQMVDGRRITDEKMLEVVTMVYAGLLNKQLVVDMQAMNGNALGMTGADLNVIQAIKRPVKTIDYGLVGDIVKVNVALLYELLEKDIIPVFCALTHDKQGQLLNTNADTVACELASALSQYYQVRLIYVFGKKGVLMNVEDDNSYIPELSEELSKQYLTEKIIQEGMIPKLHNGFNALKKGVQEVLICHTSEIYQEKPVGTRLV